MNQSKQKSMEQQTVSENLEVTIRSKSLVINGLLAQDLNKDDFVEVFMGKIKSIFTVTGKELISKKVQLEEVGYWATKIGRDINKQNECDFSDISYKKILDKEAIDKINTESSWC